MPVVTIPPRRRLCKVMVVDDSRVVREVAAALLRTRGFEVVVVESPIGFSRALARERPDVVLIDVSMPALSGDKLVEATRQSRSFRQMGEDGAPCILLLYSSLPEEELQALCASSGAQGYICKTADGDALARAISGFLRRPNTSLSPLGGSGV